MSRRRGVYWAAVSTPNSRTQSFVKKPDSDKHTLQLVQDTLAEFSKGNLKVRVSQAYEGVGHTFGVELAEQFGKKRGAYLIVFDHNQKELYSSEHYIQYNLFLNQVAELTSSKLVFSSLVSEAKKDRHYQQLCTSVEEGGAGGAGACVYYFDTYVYGK